MEINEAINLLMAKDDKIAYRNLLELEQISENVDSVYKYIEKFFTMLADEKSFIRVRGFRLICKNAKWDKKNIINRNIDKLLAELDEEKPTAVRQCLAALIDIVACKRELKHKLKEKLDSVDCSKYKESMQGLIEKDIEKLLKQIEG